MLAWLILLWNLYFLLTVSGLCFSTCRPFQFDLLALLMSLGASQFYHLAPATIEQRPIDIILRGHVQARKAIEALLVLIDPPHLLARLQHFGNCAKIEEVAATFFRPQNTAVLQQIGRFQVALVVRRCPEHVPTPIPKAYQHLGSDSLALVFGQIQHGIPSGAEVAQ